MAPIIEEFQNGKKKIVFYGSHHSFDREEIEAIRKTIDEFKPEIVLVEYGYEKREFSSEEEAIEKGDDMGFCVYYTKKKGIKIGPNDPSPEKCIEHITEKFGKEIAFTFFMFRTLDGLSRGGKIHKESFFTNYAGYFRLNTKWKGFDYSYANFRKLFKKLTGEEYGEKNNYFKYYDPTMDFNKFNEISREENEFRDNFMIEYLRKMLKEHDKIFIIKGSGHLFSCFDKIEKLVLE